jgi:hypothetical protein
LPLLRVVPNNHPSASFNRKIELFGAMVSKRLAAIGFIKERENLIFIFTSTVL